MSEVKYPRGSEWRKWDLHFHTPASFDYQDKSLTPEAIVDYLVKKDVAAVAVTDHQFMDVKFIEAMQRAGAGRITVFPGIELRSQLGGSEHVHYIGIFPEDSDLNHIWTTLQGKCDMTAQGIAARGGDDGFYVEIEKGCPIIKDLGGIVTIHAGKKSNGIEGLGNAEAVKRTVKKELASKYIHALEVGQKRDIESYQKIVFPHIGLKLPLILCSDNHDAKNYTAKENLWIKADPTFQGLRQIINEPEDRIFVGEVPPSLIRARSRATRVATQLQVGKTAGATTSEKWFDSSIPLNNELVAIIGNKGSGKSALSDIIGLLGNTPRYEAFSFLTNAKFRRSKNNKSRQFEASLTWADGKIDSVPNLDLNPSPEAVEKVKYIPQSYLEDICNEIGTGKGGRFYNELQQVIFSHVPEVERLGFGTLDELLIHRSEETNQAIAQYVANLQERNALIVATEERSLPAQRNAIEAQLAEKNRELNALIAAPPVAVPKPDADPTTLQQSKVATEDLEKKQAELRALEVEIADLRASDLAAAKKHSTAEKLSGKLKNLERHVEAFLAEAKPEFDELGIAPSDVLTFTVDPAVITALLKTLATERVGSSRVDLQACKLEYSIVSPK